MKNWIAMALGVTVLALTGCGRGSDGINAENVVHVYNYSDYIDPVIIADFEKKTGIRVVYDVYDSDEILEAKLLIGGSGYDVVVPTLNFFGRQVEAGVFRRLDKTKIPNWVNLDSEVLQRVAQHDPGNQYGVPYMIGTTGIGYNEDKLIQAFGNIDIANSWDLVFKPENIAKMQECGVTMLDTPADMIPIALNYLGENPHSDDPATLKKAADLLKSIRPYIQSFHSSQYVASLANGSTCLVVGWSGDIVQARDRAQEAQNGVKIRYAIPHEGTAQWYDVLAVPNDAKHVDNAFAFIDYLQNPEVAAANTNLIHYANPVSKSRALVDEAIRDDPGIYPPPEVTAKMFTYSVNSPETDRLYTQLWSEIKTGR